MSVDSCLELTTLLGVKKEIALETVGRKGL
jgi:hypothetical protein